MKEGGSGDRKGQVAKKPDNGDKATHKIVPNSSAGKRISATSEEGGGASKPLERYQEYTKTKHNY